MKRIAIAIAFLLLAELLYAGPYENGLKAYENGNFKEAVKWFKEAAEQGHAEAQYKLGLMYDNGQGVRQDKSKAKMLFGQACDNGFQRGCDGYRILNK
ncbi:Sel1 repeat-containing protein [Sulfurivirga caldicuralii]|uniref:Sel1 repeat-containing protein n=1 Tax=Sulfurivirga caldicuralii TaxID=364032 RepID=A0A1N6DMP5_9GAMM|nr:SEL1-like repeat protein [Sulfurivirga caldicuralii]SIN72081.1 Sel1 repeat-containing protein [Sulfurivirga caldicuralii]